MNFDLKNLITDTDERILILSAGLPRSGSTWLYNAARLLLLNSRFTRNITSYGWIQDLPFIEKKRIMLVKIHNFNDEIMNFKFPIIVLYSYRDIRDTFASAKRIWGWEPSLEDAENYFQHDLLWRNHADFIMRYEAMIENPSMMVTNLTNVLNIHDVEISQIIAQINELSYDSPGKKNQHYHMENLLHKGHFTDGRHGSWKGILDPSFVKQIERKYRDWFIQNNYPLQSD